MLMMRTSSVDDFPMSGARHDLIRQAVVMRSIGSSFVADVLEAGDRQLWRAPITDTFLRNWSGDASGAALGMRFNAALHALAREDRCAALSGLYANDHRLFDAAVGEALAEHDAFIAERMRHPPQTNEVGRAAALYAALMRAAARFGLPFDLLELGSSAGLNLNMARYGYRLGETRCGDASSPVQIAPDWSGESPDVADVTILSARGVDMRPVGIDEPSNRDLLRSFIFADQPARAARLNAALQVGQAYPPAVQQEDAVDWLRQRLEDAQPRGHCRAIFHSMFLQYLPLERRRLLIDIVEAAGRRADADRPLVHVAFEWDAGRDRVELRLTTWPDGETHLLALCHPYGAWIDWQQ